MVEDGIPLAEILSDGGHYLRGLASSLGGDETTLVPKTEHWPWADAELRLAVARAAGLDAVSTLDARIDGVLATAARRTPGARRTSSNAPPSSSPSSTHQPPAPPDPAGARAAPTQRRIPAHGRCWYIGLSQAAECDGPYGNEGTVAPAWAEASAAQCGRVGVRVLPGGPGG